MSNRIRVRRRWVRSPRGRPRRGREPSERPRFGAGAPRGGGVHVRGARGGVVRGEGGRGEGGRGAPQGRSPRRRCGVMDKAQRAAGAARRMSVFAAVSYELQSNEQVSALWHQAEDLEEKALRCGRGRRTTDGGRDSGYRGGERVGLRSTDTTAIIRDANRRSPTDAHPNSEDDSCRRPTVINRPLSPLPDVRLASRSVHAPPLDAPHGRRGRSPPGAHPRPAPASRAVAPPASPPGSRCAVAADWREKARPIEPGSAYPASTLAVRSVRHVLRRARQGRVRVLGDRMSRVETLEPAVHGRGRD